ncbi:DUF4150 domain-containing protein [uncultured Cocleimonas sp.]|uniref:DUF4150 domain-containing protein n=1 Tax=uncultured Cocleimonas sp. TaxID=1051587 RepID=UPI002628B7AB|nr:DUF4150 domain-containing protein [uncultured Cocleimonas sp.]
MANKVFANGREIACKAGKGTAILPIGDVCFTPPPPTPPSPQPPGVPIPYPSIGKASDTTKGTKKVKITNKEVYKMSKSVFKKCYGDEAGCAMGSPLKKGIISRCNRGEVEFRMSASNVKVEGKAVCRHLDIVTSNGNGNPDNTPPFPFIDGMAIPDSSDCTK